MEQLGGKIALVTGAACEPGRSHAIRLAEAGAAIIAIDICAPMEEIDYGMASVADLAETERLVRALGARIATARVDIRDLRALSDAVNASVTALGGLDIIVANAGVLAIDRSEKFTQQEWDLIFDVNLSGTWKTIRAGLPHLIARGGGSVVAVTSGASTLGLPMLDPYVASRHGVVGIVSALSIELAQKNIRVNAICPTDFAGVGMSQQTAGGKRQSAFYNAPKAKLAEEVNISDAILYLASDKARFVTGLTLPVEAGLIAS